MPEKPGNTPYSPPTHSRSLGGTSRSSSTGGSTSPGDAETLDVAKYHPYFYHLRRVEFAVNGSLTWARCSRRFPSPRAAQFRWEDFNGALHRTCADLRLRARNIGIYMATEYGGADQCHVHFLVAREGLGGVEPEVFARTFKSLWERGFRPRGGMVGGVGTAVITPYDPAYGNRGVAYCLKREFDYRGFEQERDDYLSPKLMRIIGQNNNLHFSSSPSEC